MSLFDKPKLRLLGNTGVLIEYGDAIDTVINRKVRAMTIAIDRSAPSGVIEVTPTYRSILIMYDPTVTNPSQLEAEMLSLESQLEDVEIPPPRIVEIPVLYGHEMGPDISFVADNAGMSVEEVIRLHTEPCYQIYMIGFTPGFAFLGGLPDALTTPRLSTPRAHVPAGSVGIANDQTGMYPVDSPGGWQLIGRTPLRLFDPLRAAPFLYQAGDQIKFKAISRAEYDGFLGQGAA